MNNKFTYNVLCILKILGCSALSCIRDASSIARMGNWGWTTHTMVRCRWVGLTLNKNQPNNVLCYKKKIKVIIRVISKKLGHVPWVKTINFQWETVVYNYCKKYKWQKHIRASNLHCRFINLHCRFIRVVHLSWTMG